MKVISAEFVTSAAAGGTATGIPVDGLPHVAMAGRSNVGKSTLINALGRKKIARTSAAPGKTRLANIYRLTLAGGPGEWGLYLVDLPGYGYARGGADAAAQLRAVAEAYFASRGSRFAVRGSEECLRPKRGAEGPNAATALRWPAGGTRGAAAPPIESERGWGPAIAKRSGSSVNDTRTLTAALLLVDSRHPGLDSDLQAARWLDSMGIEHRVVATKIDKLSRNERARNLERLEISFGMPPLAVSAASGEGLDALWKTIASLVRTGRE